MKKIFSIQIEYRSLQDIINLISYCKIWTGLPFVITIGGH
jgi:hypothetical protein